MFFWIREIAGWILVIIGLGLVLLALSFLSDRQVVEGGVATMAAIFIFRGGLLLIRISTAARICLQPATEKSPGRTAPSMVQPSSILADGPNAQKQQTGRNVQ